MERPVLTVPETLEGWAVLHELFQIDWPRWNKAGAEVQSGLLKSVENYLQKVSTPSAGESAIFSMLGHKGDLLLLHFRRSLEECKEASIGFQKLPFAEYVHVTQSYVSFVELGMYEMTVKLHEEFLKMGLSPESDEWKRKWRTAFEEQRDRMKGRVFPTVPDNRYFCFYPMNKRRGEQKNWYEIPIEKRQTMMRDHGMIGRKYSGQVTQVITGSIGFDDWEWGVYLFSDNPLVFKKLIYEMRFDEASAAYAEFGPFYIGTRLKPDKLAALFEGSVK
jgi:hydrogen peroxide-dependent heme synthase